MMDAEEPERRRDVLVEERERLRRRERKFREFISLRKHICEETKELQRSVSKSGRTVSNLRKLEAILLLSNLERSRNQIRRLAIPTQNAQEAYQPERSRGIARGSEPLQYLAMNIPEAQPCTVPSRIVHKPLADNEPPKSLLGHTTKNLLYPYVSSTPLKKPSNGTPSAKFLQVQQVHQREPEPSTSRMSASHTESVLESADMDSDGKEKNEPPRVRQPDKLELYPVSKLSKLDEGDASLISRMHKRNQSRRDLKAQFENHALNLVRHDVKLMDCRRRARRRNNCWGGGPNQTRVRSPLSEPNPGTGQAASGSMTITRVNLTSDIGNERQPN